MSLRDRNGWNIPTLVDANGLQEWIEAADLLAEHHPGTEAELGLRRLIALCQSVQGEDEGLRPLLRSISSDLANNVSELDHATASTLYRMRGYRCPGSPVARQVEAVLVAGDRLQETLASIRAAVLAAEVLDDAP